MSPAPLRCFLVGLFAVVAACGAQTTTDDGGGDDSSTHWLSRCTSGDDCGGLRCLCGVCSESCEGDRGCTPLGSDAVCSELPSCGEVQRVCTRPCVTDGDCGDGRCSDSVCVAAPALSAGPTPRALCDAPEDWFGESFDLGLTGMVELRSVETAIGCASGTECCNWTWAAYVVACAAGDIVLTGDAAPFGRATSSALGADDSFEPVDVTMGCQGMDCEPTCVPANTAMFGRVRARLEPSDQGLVTPGEQFESFQAMAELVIEEDLGPAATPAPVATDDCSTLEAPYLAEWDQVRGCDTDDQCTSEYGRLCGVTFEDGTSFGCQLPLAAERDLASLRSVEDQFLLASCVPDCECAQLLPAACVESQCELLPEPRSEGDLDLCDSNANLCEVVPYDHCCGLTRRAIHGAFRRAYDTHPEWQRLDDCAPNAGVCAPDDDLNAARCNIEPGASAGRCELYSTVLP